jgi:hypothetical protein
MFSSLAKSAMTISAAAGCLLMAAGSASAGSFTTNFTPTVRDADEDILLTSVQFGATTIDFSDLALVTGASIISNDSISQAALDNADNKLDNEGAASADVNDLSADGVAMEQLLAGDTASEAAVVENLGSQNLGHIIDTEDRGAFEIELNFNKAFNTLLVWERGLNSDLGIKVGGETFKLTRSMFTNAGYKLDTTEIDDVGGQEVGSYALKFSDLGLTGDYDTVTLFSKAHFNGPDFKVAGATVPEPATLLGLTAVAGAFVASRRRKGDSAA